MAPLGIHLSILLMPAVCPSKAFKASAHLPPPVSLFLCHYSAVSPFTQTPSNPLLYPVYFFFSYSSLSLLFSALTFHSDTILPPSVLLYIDLLCTRLFSFILPFSSVVPNLFQQYYVLIFLKLCDKIATKMGNVTNLLQTAGKTYVVA